jgi:hypothetical protein
MMFIVQASLMTIIIHNHNMFIVCATVDLEMFRSMGSVFTINEDENDKLFV